MSQGAESHPGGLFISLQSGFATWLWCGEFRVNLSPTELSTKTLQDKRNPLGSLCNTQGWDNYPLQVCRKSLTMNTITNPPHSRLRKGHEFLRGNLTPKMRGPFSCLIVNSSSTCHPDFNKIPPGFPALFSVCFSSI